MSIFAVKKFVGNKVEITFKDDVFNVATQSWLFSFDSFVGVLEEYHDPRCKGVLFTFERGTNIPRSTDSFAWFASRIKSIKLVDICNN